MSTRASTQGRERLAFKTVLHLSQVLRHKNLGESHTPLVPSVVPTTEKELFPTSDEPSGSFCVDPDLARVACAWDSLPEYVKRAILALVQAAQG
jgi:hypothetical protein